MSLWSGVKSFVLGQKPGDVAIPQGALEAQRRRGQLSELALQQATATGPTLGESAILSAGQRGAEQIGSQQLSMAAGARGVGAGAARADAARNAAIGQQALLSEVAIGAGRQRAADQQAAAAMSAGLLGQEEASALAMDEYRRQNARRGFLSTITGLGGALAGGLIGGRQGAQAGYGLGYGAGEAGLGAAGYR